MSAGNLRRFGDYNLESSERKVIFTHRCFLPDVNLEKKSLLQNIDIVCNTEHTTDFNDSSYALIYIFPLFGDILRRF